MLWRAPIPGTHSRLLLASDGLWDVISHAQACKLVRGAATAQRAADLLLGMAERISNEKRGRTVEKITWSRRRYTEDRPRRRLYTSHPNGRPACGRPPSRARAWARLCSPVRLGHGMGAASSAASVACLARHVWRHGRHSPTRRPDRTAHTTLTALTSEHTPARFGRLKDDTTVLVVDVDLRSEAMRQAAKKKDSCCVVC